MFQVGRSSVPKPAPRSLEDLDSVQRVLLHRSVLGRGRPGRGSSPSGVSRKSPGILLRALLALEGRWDPHPPFAESDALDPRVSPLGVWPHAGPAHPPPPENTALYLKKRKNDEPKLFLKHV